MKKCGAESGDAALASIKDLINEHNTFKIVTVDEEAEKLQQSMCGYCICRLPYEGFMIGCDGCEEWYHGPCVGMTEEQAAKFDKYVCVRCSTLRILKENTATVATTLKKWTSAKNLSRARTLDSQRYGRKFRQCERDIAKSKETIAKYEGMRKGHVGYDAAIVPPVLSGSTVAAPEQPQSNDVVSASASANTTASAEPVVAKSEKGSL